jgi:PIN domain nuclease of toxin-antitoxin system
VKLLLDTCTFLWFNADAPALSPRARAMCLDSENELYLSVISAWEITLKHMAGRLPLPEPAAQYVPSRRQANGIISLELSEETVLQLPKLPPLHGDPFDRMLVCQAIVHGLAILTPDEWITRYPVRVMW